MVRQYVEERRPRAARSAVLQGFSLHADTAVHSNNREGLRQLCRYGARGLWPAHAPARPDGRGSGADGALPASCRRLARLPATHPSPAFRGLFFLTAHR
jgi:hypothetical protein